MSSMEARRAPCDPRPCAGWRPRCADRVASRRRSHRHRGRLGPPTILQSGSSACSVAALADANRPTDFARQSAAAHGRTLLATGSLLPIGRRTVRRAPLAGAPTRADRLRGESHVLLERPGSVHARRNRPWPAPRCLRDLDFVRCRGPRSARSRCRSAGSPYQAARRRNWWPSAAQAAGSAGAMGAEASRCGIVFRECREVTELSPVLRNPAANPLIEMWMPLFTRSMPGIVPAAARDSAASARPAGG